MPKYARWQSPGVPEIFDGGRDIVVGEGEDAVRHPRNIVNLWDDADLQALGLMKLVEAATPPGEIVTGRDYIEVAGEIHEQLTTEPAPTPPDDPAVEIVTRLQAAQAAGAAATDLAGLQTAFDDLCDALAGQQPGQASQIAGKPK